MSPFLKKALRILLYGLLAVALTAAVALFLIVKLALAPARGEWSTRVRAGPLSFEIGVPTAIRLATSSQFAPWLDGHSLDTRLGTVHAQWLEPSHSLALRCAPCSLSVPALGPQPLRVDNLRLTVRRDIDTLGGQLEAVLPAMPAASAAPAATQAPSPSAATPRADAGGTLRAQWSGRLTQQALQLDVDVPDTPIASWYALLTPQLPELQRARIQGQLALHLQLALPSQHLTVQPRLTQFSVEGLGTEALLGARTSCGPSARLTRDSWLARAVIAAEDQRFFQHPGYDLAELGAALQANQASGGVERGGSTLTQQLAKMLVTGGERSLERKLRELLYAAEMEQTLGKARILQLYLDNAPWGGTICGAEAAARRYFKRSAVRLEPAQAVWLATMLHKPSVELSRWEREGSVDPARLQWVAEGVRGISRAQREALLKSVADARFPPPGG